MIGDKIYREVSMERDLIYSLFSSPHVIETERLLLRPIRIEDARDMYEYCSVPEVSRYVTWERHPSESFTKRNIRRILKGYKAGTFFDFAIEYKENGKMIGTCGYTSFDFDSDSAEIGYVVNPDYQRISVATEAASEVISYAFEVLGAKRVFARFIEGNDASRRVMEKCRMEYETTHEHGAVKDGRFVRVTVYSLTRDRYFAVNG